MEHKTDCLICGSELEYLEQREKLQCYFCREPVLTNVRCAQNHYVCDKCHSSGTVALIERYTIRTRKTDPMEMAIDLMKSKSFTMHGSEHHFLVPAVLLASYYNLKIQKGHPELMAEKEKKIREARIRSEKVLGGFCGFYGACGAAIGTGIFVSLVTSATPLSVQEWKLSNTATATCLSAIACAGGPRCCKRDTFLSIQEAVQFINENLGVSIPANLNVHCNFSELNHECLKFGCQFYQ
ncbi:MAG: DUF5714 domain-containing protein [Bacteroidales bacterium]